MTVKEIDKKLKTLSDKFDSVRHEINALNEARFKKEELPRMKKLVGKCYKFRNAYSGASEAEKWWKYSVVTGLKNRSLTSFDFEIDRDGKLSIDTNCYFTLYNGWIEVSRSEFNEAWISANNIIKKSLEVSK